VDDRQAAGKVGELVQPAPAAPPSRLTKPRLRSTRKLPIPEAPPHLTGRWAHAHLGNVDGAALRFALHYVVNGVKVSRN
jgi:hypothetical protein